MPKHLHQRRAGLVKDIVHPLQLGVELLLRGGGAAVGGSVVAARDVPNGASLCSTNPRLGDFVG